MSDEAAAIEIGRYYATKDGQVELRLELRGERVGRLQEAAATFATALAFVGQDADARAGLTYALTACRDEIRRQEVCQ